MYDTIIHTLPLSLALCIQVGIVKLHSELELPTELQLDRVGVDFVSPPSQLSNK